jgi:2,3-bisphosphoglycerate-dependent phosphoglycerate mutase
MSLLILLRHGQSQWNLENRFTGWVDVPLTDAGRKDAVLVGKSLRDFHVDMAFLSRLVRSAQTFEAFCEGHGQKGIPTLADSALNERHYGDLQGLNKADVVAKYGLQQVQLWRRSYATRPPGGESIEDCERRTWPFFLDYILPELKNGKNVLVVAHGNSLRPIMKNLDHLSPEAAATMEINCSVPYVYTFEGQQCIKKEIRDVPGMDVKGTSKIV